MKFKIMRNLIYIRKVLFYRILGKYITLVFQKVLLVCKNLYGTNNSLSTDKKIPVLNEIRKFITVFDTGAYPEPD